MYQFELACLIEMPNVRMLPPSDGLRSDLNNSTRNCTVKISNAQRDIHKLLLKMGLKTELEVSPFEDDMGGFLSIDIACRDKKLAIEFDGPSHFLSNGTHNGVTQFKTRLLKKLGWNIIRIPFREWAELSNGHGGKDERAGYLRNKIGDFK